MADLDIETISQRWPPDAAAHQLPGLEQAVSDIWALLCEVNRLRGLEHICGGCGRRDWRDEPEIDF